MLAWLPAWLPEQPKSPLPGGQGACELGALGGTRTPNLLIRRDTQTQTHPLPAHTSVDLPKYCAAMRHDCRRYAALCGQNPASIARWLGRPGRPTTVKPRLTPASWLNRE